MSKLLQIAVLIIGHLSVAIGQQDTSSSPYFAVTNGDLSQFPLEATQVNAMINGPIANVTVTQRYTNNGSIPIEGIYLFPASTRAAVHHMEMKIGDRTIKAVIKKKEEARQTYEKAKQEGKRTALLEEERANVFQMNVANIMPGESIEITMKYSEFILPQDQQYEFIFPTVVGPRYTGEKSEKYAAQPYTKSGKLPLSTLDIKVQINTAVPIGDVCIASHVVKMDKMSPTQLLITTVEQQGANRDFIVKYSLSGDRIASGLLTFQQDGTSYFLCQIEPPSLSAAPVIVPREYIFLVDVSGSMRGFPLDISKRLMKNLVGNLRPIDQFNVMFFAGSAYTLSPSSLPATKANLDRAITEIDNEYGGGGTNMLAAIKKAMALTKTPGYSRSFVIVTDGYVTVEEEAFQYINSHLATANFFAFGIGSSVNRLLIEGLANAGRGEAFIVEEDKQASIQAAKLKSYIEHPLLTDISISSNGVELYDIVPNAIPDLMARRPIYLFGKYKINTTGASITLQGMKAGNKLTTTLKFQDESKDENSAIRYLWAREKIRFLDDFNYFGSSKERIEEITNLGLDHNLLTKWTSFVAVDNQVVSNGNPIQKNQPLPMPQGVSNSAIGFEMEVESMTSYGGDSAKVEIEVSTQDHSDKLLMEMMLEIILSDKQFVELLSEDRCIEFTFDHQGILIGMDGFELLKSTLNDYIENLNHVFINKHFAIKISRK